MLTPGVVPGGVDATPGADAPRIQMLWEAADPHTILRERFGFADAAAVRDWVSAALRQHWGITVTGCSRVVMSDRNALAWLSSDRGPLLAKWCVAPDRFGRLAALADLTVWLDDRGLPVSRPLTTADGRVQVETSGVSLAVQRVVRGDLLDVSAPGQAHRAGRMLAQFHRALRDHPDPADIIPDATTTQETHRQVTQWLDQAPRHLPPAAVEALRRMLGQLDTTPLPAQLGHGDFRSANVLCRDGEVVAVLDLEECRLEPRVLELARSTVLLGTQFHDWGPTPLDVRTRFVGGYQEVWPLDDRERAWLPALVLWMTLVFVPPRPDPTGWADAALELVART